MTNRWKTIWNSKGIVSENKKENEYEEFCLLKRANGFDVAVDDEQAYYKAFYQEWNEFYKTTTELIGADIESVYEVGCGSGVNLFMFKNRISHVTLGGCDYSKSMVKSVANVIGSGDFLCHGADEMSIEPKYDIVMAESVFQYFPSINYAEEVLKKMIEKSTKLTYLGEVHDSKYEKELMDYRRKTIDNYDERYKDLNKLFIPKDLIEKIAAVYGKKVLFTEKNNPEYLNGKYEYNCYLY